MAGEKQIFICPATKCKKNVTDNQYSVGCFLCGEFYHIQCVKITREQHSVMHKLRKNFLYRCPKCSKADVSAKVNSKCNELDISTNEQVAQDLDSRFASLTASMDQKQLEYKLEVDKLFNDHRSQFEMIINKVREELMAKIVKLEYEVGNCTALIKHVDKNHTDSIREIQTHHDVTRRRLNRADIIINGLPSGINHLRDPIIKIGMICGVVLTQSDIQHCCYLSNGKAVLVKLNSVYLRDSIMINYHRRGSILLSDILPEGVASRVFLNDNFNEATGKLLFVCRRLREQGKILKFKLFSADRPKAFVTYLDESVKLLDIQQCADMLDADRE